MLLTDRIVIMLSVCIKRSIKRYANATQNTHKTITTQ